MQISTVRELVSCNLSRFQSEGLIEIDRRKLTLLNSGALNSEITAG